MKKAKTKLRLPASSAHVWGYCGGSQSIRSARDPFGFSDDARRGVVVHKVSANALKIGLGLSDAVEQLDAVEFQIYEKDKANIEAAVKFYVDTVVDDFTARRAADPKTALYVETVLRVETAAAIIEGPPDAVIYSPKFNSLTVYDLKSGWAEIDAENNLQLMTYAHSFAENFGLWKSKTPLKMRGVIVQPNLSQIDPTEIIPDKGFFNRVTPNPARFTVGAHCGACQVRPACKAFQDKIKQYLHPKFKDATTDRLAKWPELLEIAKPAEKFYKEIYAQANSYLKAGGTIPGYGLKPVSVPRQWKPETTPERLAQRFGLKPAAVQSVKIETPAEVEKILSAARVKNAGDLTAFYYSPTVPRLTKTGGNGDFLPKPAAKKKSKKISKEEK
jgi:hypothetical protein